MIPRCHVCGRGPASICAECHREADQASDGLADGLAKAASELRQATRQFQGVLAARGFPDFWEADDALAALGEAQDRTRQAFEEALSRWEMAR